MGDTTLIFEFVGQFWSVIIIENVVHLSKQVVCLGHGFTLKELQNVDSIARRLFMSTLISSQQQPKSIEFVRHANLRFPRTV